jgi:two-component system response regulator PilR (NtrC family)
MDGQIQLAIAGIAESDCPVMIIGERGVGKRSIAERIHSQSSRSKDPFKEYRCRELDREATLSALCDNGTAYLNEINDLSLPLQDLIMTTYFHVESPKSCRLVLSSTRELEDEVMWLRIREDFYHMVSAVTLRIPPLRCRKAEILSITEELLMQYSKQFDRPKPILRDDIIAYLMDHDWPGNLPELQTAIKTLVAIGDQSISLAALKAAAPTANLNGQSRPQSLKEAARGATAHVERKLISAVLVSTGGNRKRAASELGISYKALLYKLKHIEAENRSESKEIGVAQ